MRASVLGSAFWRRRRRAWAHPARRSGIARLSELIRSSQSYTRQRARSMGKASRRSPHRVCRRVAAVGSNVCKDQAPQIGDWKVLERPESAQTRRQLTLQQMTQFAPLSDIRTGNRQLPTWVEFGHSLHMLIRHPSAPQEHRVVLVSFCALWLPAGCSTDGKCDIKAPIDLTGARTAWRKKMRRPEAPHTGLEKPRRQKDHQGSHSCDPAAK